MSDNEKTWDAMDSSGELSDDELDGVSGGNFLIDMFDKANKERPEYYVVGYGVVCNKYKCNFCGSGEVKMMSGGRAHLCFGGNINPSACSTCEHSSIVKNQRVCYNPSIRVS